MKRARAIVFDVGGTLWHHPPGIFDDKERSHRQSAERTRALLAPCGVGNEGALAIQNELWHEYENRIRDDSGVEPDGATILEGVLSARGLPSARMFAEQLWERTNLGASFFGAQLFEDALPVLEWARDRGLRLGILSNRPFGGELHQADLEALGIAGFFKVAVASADVGLRKPHPEPFLRVLRELEVAAGEAVMVGDILEADVAGGHEAGMVTVWLHREGLSTEGWDRLYPDVEVTPDYTIQSLDELKQLPLFASGR